MFIKVVSLTLIILKYYKNHVVITKYTGNLDGICEVCVCNKICQYDQYDHSMLNLVCSYSY